MGSSRWHRMHSMVSGVRSTTSTGAALGRGRRESAAGGPSACRARAREWRTTLPAVPRVSDVQPDDLVADYLAAREPHDRDVLTPADAAGAVAALLALGRNRTPGTRIVRVHNPTRAVDGWESPHTVVEVVGDDAPFLVDSVSSALARRGYDIHLLIRPLFDVEGVGRTSHLHL